MKTRTFVLATMLAAAGAAGAEKAPPATARSAVAWFTATAVAERVFRIDDHGADNLYLVLGAEKALLIDTGLGVADVAGFVRTLTTLPLVVVNTHGHPDHAGGNYQFAEVHAGRGDFELARSFNAKEHRAAAAPLMLRGATVPEGQLYHGPVYDTVMVPVARGFVFDLDLRGRRPDLQLRARLDRLRPGAAAVGGPVTDPEPAFRRAAVGRRRAAVAGGTGRRGVRSSEQ